MRALAKVGLVGAGYIGAFAIAWAVVAVHIATTQGPDRRDYAAMFDFGDSLLFLGVFGLAAVLPTGAALFFLRPYRWFWRALSVAAMAMAATAAAAFVVMLLGRDAGTRSAASAAAASLRILIAPLFALAFAVSTAFAPSRNPRLALLAATATEAIVFCGHFLLALTIGRAE
jgi:Kef-type K+ transport system membrane component KefB